MEDLISASTDNFVWLVFFYHSEVLPDISIQSKVNQSIFIRAVLLKILIEKVS